MMNEEILRDVKTFERFVGVMAGWAVIRLIAAHYENHGEVVDPSSAREAVMQLLAKAELPPEIATPENSRALLRMHGKELFSQTWEVARANAVKALHHEHQKDALSRLTAERAWRQIMY
jgi:hypothetical protein